MPSPFFQITSGIVGLPGGNFIFVMDEEEIARRNRQRSPLEYREHLFQLVRDCIWEGMSNDEWAAAMGWDGRLLKETPNPGEDKDDEDPHFDEKKKVFSLAMRLAQHIRRPDSFRPPSDLPEDDLSSSGSTRSNVSRSEDDLPGEGGTRPDQVTGGSNEATFVAMEESPLAPEVLAAEEPAEAPAPAAEARRPAAARKPKKKHSVSFDEHVLGGKPIRPTVADLAKLPAKKDLFLGAVSVKKSDKDMKALLVTANGRIRQLENYILNSLHPRCVELHGQLTQAVNSGWECIEQQDNSITFLRRQVATLERDALNLEKATLEKDRKKDRNIMQLQS